jgi:uncharacterized coiled-coil protein SlyX
MGDVDYQSLLLSYQRKVVELINQNIVYEAKLNTLSQTIKDLTEKIQSLESSQKEDFE